MSRRDPLVLPGRRGRRIMVHQLDVEQAPFTNCRLVVATMQLTRAGIRIPDKPRFIRALRRATGVPEIGPDGAQGTSAADLIRGLAILVPWVPVEARLWDDDELLDAIAGGEVAAGVPVTVYNSLPGDLDRWSPRFADGHMIDLPGARPGPADPKVLWCDPLGTGRYRGEWVSWRRVKPHLSQSGGRVFATTIAIGAAMSTSIVLSRVFPAGTTATLHKGIGTYTYDEDAMAFVAAKPVASSSKAPADTLVAVDQQPRGPGRPRGRFVRIAGGPLSGRYVALADVGIVEPAVTDPTNIDALVAAAYADGKAAGVSETEDRYELVDEPLYRQAVPA